MHLHPENVRGEALEELAAEASAAGLPIDDLRERGRILFAYRDPAGIVVGYGRLELLGDDALLRTVVVKPRHRGEGHGRKIVEDLLARASQCGARQIWLLTTSAESFFSGLGFIPAARDEAPSTISGSQEFSSLCPASAVLMRRRSAPTS